MKKIFTLCVSLLITMCAIAQSLNYSHHGEVLANGGNYTIAGKFEEQSCESGVFLMGQLLSELSLVNTTNSETNITIKIDVTAGGLSICSFGNCVLIDTATVELAKIKTGTMAANSTVDLQIEIMVIKTGDQAYNTPEVLATIPECVFSITSYPTSNPTDVNTIYVTLKYDNTSALSNISAETKKPVIMQGSNLNYNVAGASSLSLYSISGTMVKSVALDAPAGNVSLSHLPKGIYLYRIDGQKEVCGKVIVK